MKLIQNKLINLGELSIILYCSYKLSKHDTPTKREEPKIIILKLLPFILKLGNYRLTDFS